MEHVDGVQLLNDLEAYYRKYARTRDAAYAILPAWVLHCHAFKAFTRTPYLHITSPTVNCGKTTLLEITELIVPNAIQTSGLSEAVLARTIDKEHPVLLLDELDELQKGNKELLAAIMATINSGYKKSGRRTILIQTKGKDWEPKHLSTFCPKMLASIGRLPAAARSRSISLRMERLALGERVADVDEYTTEPEANALFLRAQEWAKAHLLKLRDARPACPPELRNRQREVSRPLLAVADAAGGDWPTRIRAALLALFTGSVADDQTTSIKLLADIRMIFSNMQLDKLASNELIDSLVDIEESPWAEFNHGKKITAVTLARLLRDFEITPRSIRLSDGSTPKGYKAEQFTDAWGRYLSSTPTSETPHPPHCSIDAGQTHFLEAPHDPLVAGEKSEEKPVNMRVVAGVADQDGDRGEAVEEQGAVALPEKDYLLGAAIQLCRQAGVASVRAIKDGLLVSTAQAIQYIDQMEAMGLVGPANGGRPRAFLRGGVQ